MGGTQGIGIPPFRHILTNVGSNVVFSGFLALLLNSLRGRIRLNISAFWSFMTPRPPSQLPENAKKTASVSQRHEY